MNKAQQPRWFLIGCTLLVTVLFALMCVLSTLGYAAIVNAIGL